MTLKELVENYIPYNEQESKDKEFILKCFVSFDDILTRNNEFVHFASSAIILNKTRDKWLMIHHNIYNSWSWVGGHADGEDDMLNVALREAKEETGIENIKPITKNIFSVDVLPVLGHFKHGKYVSAHTHLSTSYLFEADENDDLMIKEDENSDVKWIPISDVVSSSNEPHMKVIYQKIIDKLSKL